MPNIPLTWLNEFTANLTTSGEQISPDIIQLADGRFLVAWRSNDNTGVGSPAGTDIIGQLFDPLGGLIGTEFRINLFSTISNEGKVSLAPSANGGFFAVYESINFAGATSICLDSYDAALTVGPGSFVVSDLATSDPNYSNPHIASSGPASVLIVYEQTTAGVSQLVGKIYNPTGSAYGGQFNITSGVNGGVNADVTVLANGNYVVTGNTTNADAVIFYAIYNSSGGVLLPPTAVTGTSANGFNDREPSVAALTGGGFVIAYTNTDASDTDVFWQLHDAAGTALTGNQINTTATNNSNEPAVTGLADGSFVIVYDDDELNLLNVVHFSAAGVSLGSFSFAQTATRPAVTSLADGRFAVTWDAGDNIKVEILDTRDAINPPVYPGAWQVGTIGNDAFTHSSLGAIIHGWDGDDLITEDSLDAAQSIYGDAGNDTITVISAIGQDAFYGGNGIDTIDWSACTDSDVTFSMDTSAAYTVNVGEVMQDFENLIGTPQADIIVGTQGDNMLSGGGGNDSIFGASGNDTLIGGIGADSLVGGDGNDFYYVDATDIVIEDAGGSTGYDIVIASVNFTLSDNVEQLVLQGGATIGIGNATANYLYGGNSGLSLNLDGAGGDDVIYSGLAGHNTITGGAGTDTLLIYGGNNFAAGGLGNDVYYTYTATDTLSEAGGDGIDTVYANWNFTMGAGFEQLLLFGSANTAVGNAGPNNIYGNSTSGAVNLFGMGGADVLFGGAGNDTLDGGSENDYLFGLGGTNTLTGGFGNDIYYLETAGNTIIESVIGNFDTVYSNAAGTTTLAANVEQLILYGAATGGVGSADNNYIYANSATGAVTLDGGIGNDYLLDSMFDDVLTGGSNSDQIDLQMGGNDIVRYEVNQNLGVDYIYSFDANPAGGQDLIDLTGRGYNVGSIGGTITIGASGANTLISFTGGSMLGTSITLVGIAAANVTAGDFLF